MKKGDQPPARPIFRFERQDMFSNKPLTKPDHDFIISGMETVDFPFSAGSTQPLGGRFLPAILFSVFLGVAGPSYCPGAINLITSPGSLGADAFLDWADIGPSTTSVTTPAFFIDLKQNGTGDRTAMVARVSENYIPTSEGFRRLHQGGIGYSSIGIGHDYWAGRGFSDGEELLWSGWGPVSPPPLTSDIGFDFSQPVFGFGVQLEANRYVQDVAATIEAFDSDGMSLGLLNFTASAYIYSTMPFGVDRAGFIGVTSTTREISSVLIRADPAAQIGGWVMSEPLIKTGTLGPSGVSFGLAIQPTEVMPRSLDGAWVFESVAGTGRWFDPPLTEGYTYETDGNSKFIKVELPTGIGDVDNQFVISDSINGSTLVLGGALHQFATPVDKFTVSGIDPTVDGGDPSAFPTYLEFDQGIVSFTQTPVPEPSSIALALLGAAGALWFKRHRTATR